MFLPPYSPDLNPIDMPFARLRRPARLAMRTIDLLLVFRRRSVVVMSPLGTMTHDAP